MTTFAKYRHLSQCSTSNGHFVILAIDHRANLLETLNKHAAAPLNDSQFVDFKQQLIRHLLPSASAVLTDPAYGIGPGIADLVISGQHGLLAPIEVTDYHTHPSLREMQMIPNWSVAKIKQVGGTGVKLLLTYHPEAVNAQQQCDFAASIIEECALHDIPFFLEPVTYSLNPNTPLDTVELRQIVVEMAGLFSKMGVDILKLQFPVDPAQETDETVWAAACKEIDAACMIPWALLSGGVDFETFARQTRVACEAGASGVMVGRAVWAEATKLTSAACESFLSNTAQQRMLELASICAQHARPWYKRVEKPALTLNWYESDSH